PNRCQRAGLAKTTLVRLLRGVIMRMHDHGIRTINDSITLAPAPSGVFVIFGILHFLQKTAFGPDIFSQATAHHAEEMFPAGRRAGCAKAPLVIVGINRLTTGTRDLAAEHRRDLRVLQWSDERPKPILSLGSRIRVQENP